METLLILEQLLVDVRELITSKEYKENDASRFQELSTQLIEAAGNLVEVGTERQIAALDAELEREFSQQREPIEEPVGIPAPSPVKPESVSSNLLLDTFVSEASGLEDYNRESDLNRIFPESIKIIKSDKFEGQSYGRFFRKFIDLATTMVERRRAVEKTHNLIPIQNVTKSETLLKSMLKSYGSSRSNKTSMRNMGSTASKG